MFRDERTAGVEEISRLRERVAEEESRRKTAKSESTPAAQEDTQMDAEGERDEKPVPAEKNGDVKMDVDEGRVRDEKPVPATAAVKDEKKDTPTPGPGDDDDAVEY